MANISRVKLGSLECIQVINNSKAPYIVLLHGYGANADDLFSLWEIWQTAECNWIFPHGPQNVDFGGMWAGKAWFPIEQTALAHLGAPRSKELFANYFSEGIATSLKLLDEFLIHLSKHNEIVLGGFSQGAMMASHLLMNSSIHFKAIILMSATLLGVSKLQKLYNEENKNTPIFQSHGMNDAVLNIGGALDLKNHLLNKEMKVEYHEFMGGHEIPQSIVLEIKRFLAKNLNSST